MPEQMNTMPGLDYPPTGANPDGWPQYGTAERCDEGWTEYNISEVMVLQLTARANQIRLRSVKLHVTVKEVEAHTVITVSATHFGVKIVESAAIIFVNITVFYKHPMHITSD